jgi:predicted AlkP superfamily pyrophosphatase or phosphodiesterase
MVILIDAFRYDYLSEERTPFLYRIGNTSPSFPLKSILGYSDAIRATIFTGTYPNKHNYWMTYRYSPHTSPFTFLGKFSFIDRAPHFLSPWLKFALSRGSEVWRKKKAEVRNLPLKMAPLFDYTVEKEFTAPGAFENVPTIFDVLRENGTKFSYLTSDQFGWRYFLFARSIRGRLLQAIKKTEPETQFTFLYLHYLDNAGHRCGTKSRIFLRELKEVDSLIEHILAQAQATFGDIETIIFSDHGLADATEYINFGYMMKDTGFGTDYLLVLDSTMVRIWYLNGGARDGVRRRFEGLNYGHFLSQEEREELKIDFSHRYYGDDIYLIEPPYNIFPNSISLLKPHAMHAYHPDLESQRGIAIFKGALLSGAKPQGDYVHLVDLMPTMLKVLGLEAPSICEGVSLV